MVLLLLVLVSIVKEKMELRRQVLPGFFAKRRCRSLPVRLGNAQHTTTFPTIIYETAFRREYFKLHPAVLLRTPRPASCAQKDSAALAHESYHVIPQGKESTSCSFFFRFALGVSSGRTTSWQRRISSTSFSSSDTEGYFIFKARGTPFWQEWKTIRTAYTTRTSGKLR